MPRCVLGTSERAFGVRYPNHGRVLLDNIPACLGYDVGTLRAHSLVPLYDPFLESEQREFLMMTIMNGQVRGSLCRDTTAPLKSCPGCVKDDIQRHRVAYWHAISQHEGALACSIHRCRLVESRATLAHAPRLLHAPEWINPDEPIIPASAAELQLADDLSWLCVENKSLPGSLQLVTSLRHILHQHAAYGRGHGAIKVSALRADIQAHYGDSLLQALGCRLGTELNRSITPNLAIKRYQMFSIISCIAGVTLPELFAHAAGPRPFATVARTSPVRNPVRLARSKEIVLKIIAEMPTAGRYQVRMACESHFDYVRKCDPQWMLKHIPERKKSISSKPRTYINWRQRDSEWILALKDAHARMLRRESTTGVRRIVFNNLVREAGLVRCLIFSRRARLPETFKMVAELVDTDVSFARRCTNGALSRRSVASDYVSRTSFIRKNGLRSCCLRSREALTVVTAAWRRYCAESDSPNAIDVEFGCNAE